MDTLITRDSVDAISSLASGAYKFGPFLFSLLFIFVVVGKAHNIYQEAIRSRSSSIGQVDIWVYWIFLLTSMVFSIGLVVYSILWWRSSQTGLHVYTSEIRGLPRTATIEICEENSVYINYVIKSDNNGNFTQLYRLAATSPRAFNDDRQFRLRYSDQNSQGTRGGSQRCNLLLPYTGKRFQAFVLPADLTKSEILVAISSEFDE